jgi:triosephosphate isomerase (TIM)
MYIFANWKMYLDFDETMILTNQLLQAGLGSDEVEFAIFPNTLAFTEVEKAFRDSVFAIGAQNVHHTSKGAYTGSTSAQMFANVGAQYTLVGHSERRHIFGETNDDVRKKMEACFESNIVPVLCIGETAEDCKTNKREYRIKKQLQKALEGLDISSHELLVAYEPVWAITGSGTGESCDTVDAERMHTLIKTELKSYSDKSIPVLYGGSVSEKNVLSYVSLPSVDGVLVGSASTSFDGYISLVANAQARKK